MNEELKIIIRAITADAQKNIEKVKKDLDKLEKTGKSSGAAVDKAMKGFAKGAGIAAAAVATLTTAMIALGKQSVEFQKNYNRLTASFTSSGSTVKQAAETYKQLFRFMGDSDTATEASNLLVQLTNDEKKLAEWTQILQGVYAKFPDSLPVEALAESANETARVGKVTGNLADALNWMGVSEDAFNAKLATTNSLSEREAMIRETLTALYGDAAKAYENTNQSLMRYNESQANVDMALANATRLVIPLMTAFNNLSATLLSVLAPAISTISTYLTAFIELLTEAIAWVGNFFGIVGSKSRSTAGDFEGYQKAMKNYNDSLQKSFNGASKGAGETLKTVKELKKQTMGFDELNVVQSPVASSGAASGGGSAGGNINIPSAPNPADFGLTGDLGLDLESFKKDVEEAKERIKSILVLVGLVAAGLLAWKIATILPQLTTALKLLKKFGFNLGKIKAYGDIMGGEAEGAAKLLGTLKRLTGIVLIVAGAIALVKGYSEAWAKGIDWDNFGLILAGIAAIVGGLALTFGRVAAGIGLVAGSIAMVVVGIKDMMANGVNLQNFLLVLIGIMGTVIGVLITMGQKNIEAAATWLSHTAALIGHKVATIAATVAEKAMAIAQAALNLVMSLSPLTWIVLAIAAVVAALVILWVKCEGFRDLVKAVGDAIVDAVKWLIDKVVGFFKSVIAFVADNWQALLLLLVNPFAGAFKLLYDNCDGFRAFIDKWVAKIGEFFSNLWKSIQKTFSGIGKWFKDIFTGAWNGIKNAWSSVGSFFSGIWTNIKKIFSNVGSAIGNAITNTVKTAINGVLSAAVKIINGFISAINLAIDIINAIPGVNIKTLSKLSVPKMAKGGIVDSATLAVIGERGKEAVMPLENNTGWMDTLADRIASRNQAPSRIVLALDGKELGWANINSINNITKQTGELQLVLG